jgi:hypothetical protein
MPTIEAQELEERLSRIRLPVNEMARRVNCDPVTITGQLKRKRRANGRLLRDVVDALTREEHAMLAHLVRLHPDQARAALQAA